MIAALWHSIPEGALKRWARETYHNHLESAEKRTRAKYRREGKIFVIETPEFTMRAAEPTYGVPDLLAQFESRHKVGRGEIVFDAGAFGGMLTNAFAKEVGPEGRVISFEPDALNRARVLKNLSLNGDPANVEVIAAGLWDSEGEVGFCERGALGSSALWDGEGGRRTTIQTTTIDRVVAQRNLPRLDFIKMNIEGAEIRALRGAAETIEKFKPHFAIFTDHIIDGNFAGMGTSGAVEEILRSHGYTAETQIYGAEWMTFGTPPQQPAANRT